MLVRDLLAGIVMSLENRLTLSTIQFQLNPGWDMYPDDQGPLTKRDGRGLVPRWEALRYCGPGHKDTSLGMCALRQYFLIKTGVRPE